jgi:hypothetical protein
MLVLAFLSLFLAVHAVRSCSVALENTQRVSTANNKHSDRHTLILLSRHGTHAVVTCFRGAFLVCDGADAVFTGWVLVDMVAGADFATGSRAMRRAAA